MHKGNGKIIVLVAPSGAGKSTLLKKIKNDFKEIVESISTTTRSPRKGEEEGVHYFFVKRDEFQKMIKEDQFIEWAEVHGNYYGSSKTFVENMLAKDKVLLCDIDVQGAEIVRKLFPKESCIIFVAPPSIEELERRLVSRGTDDRKTIDTRLKNAEIELKKMNNFDFLVINDNLDAAYSKIKDILINKANLK